MLYEVEMQFHFILIANCPSTILSLLPHSLILLSLSYVRFQHVWVCLWLIVLVFLFFFFIG